LPLFGPCIGLTFHYPPLHPCPQGLVTSQGHAMSPCQSPLWEGGGVR
jgi:hypothetical protein